MAIAHTPAPERFFQRFRDGTVLDLAWPRITTRESEQLFPARKGGLKVLLINPPVREWSYPNVLPLGQAYISSVIVMDGHHLSVLDLNAERREPVTVDDRFFEWMDRRIAQALDDVRPDVIGIGGIITQYARVKRIAVLCREKCREATIILGGGMSSCLPSFMLRYLPIDVAVCEEAEVTISELLFRLEEGLSLKGLKGTVYREPDGEIVDNGLRPSLQSRELGLDGLPWPLYSRWHAAEIYRVNPVGHLNWARKWNDGGAEGGAVGYSISMIASRGCPYAVSACDYCYASYLGKTYRLRSPKDLVDEMVYIAGEYDLAYIHFNDDLLLTDYRWAMSWFEELGRRREETGFAIQWGGTCRANIIANDIARATKQGRPHILELAHAVGMRQAGYGIESGSPTILAAIDKSGQTVDKIKLAIRETQRVLGYADCSFMVGSPGETPTTIQETVDMCKEVGLSPEVLFFTTAYPATPFWNLALEKGLVRKMVTGEKGPADDDIIEQYFLRLGEQGEQVSTNFSDIPDAQLVELSWKAIREMGAQNVHRHPHTGDRIPVGQGAMDPSRATI